MPSSLTGYRLACANHVPFIGVTCTTGAQATPPAGSYVGTPDTADALRLVVSSDLADIGRTATMTDTASDWFQGGYVWIPSRGEQRRISDQGYVDSVDADDPLSAGGAVQVGAVYLNRNLATALAPGTAVEIHPLIPVLNADRLPGWHTLINRALRSMRWVRRIAFTGNAGDRYSLAAHPEITHEAQVAAAYMAETGSNTEPSPLYGGASLRWDADAGYLITGQYQSSGSPFTVDFYIPASAWIKVGGTWAASAVGLVNETDEAMPPVDQVVKVAQYFAFDALSRYAPAEADRSAWMYERDRAAVIARQFMHFMQPEVKTSGPAVSRLATSGASMRTSWP